MYILLYIHTPYILFFRNIQPHHALLVKENTRSIATKGTHETHALFQFRLAVSKSTFSSLRALLAINTHLGLMGFTRINNDLLVQEATLRILAVIELVIVARASRAHGYENEFVESHVAKKFINFVDALKKDYKFWTPTFNEAETEKETKIMIVNKEDSFFLETLFGVERSTDFSDLDLKREEQKKKHIEYEEKQKQLRIEKEKMRKIEETRKLKEKKKIEKSLKPKRK